MRLPERWDASLEQLRRQGRYRELASPRGIDFSSNDYLGYSSVAPAVSAVPDSLPRSGKASRLLNGNHLVWSEIESRLAHWHGAGAALMMTSGYVANEGLLSTVVEPNDWVASDELNHASIIDGLRLARAERFIYRHCDLNDLEQGLRSASRTRTATAQKFVVTESIFSMEGTAAPLEQMIALAERHGAHVIVDEAHATGCLGPEGSGLVDGVGVRGRVLATVHTGGKALGVQGAYICGSSRLKEFLINRCRQLIFTTALAPALGFWWDEGITRVRADHAGRRALAEGTELFRSELTRRGILALGKHYIVPLLVGDESAALEAARRLHERNWDIRAIRPPSVSAGTSRLRVSVHADHAPDTLHALAASLAEVLQRL